jgi:Domain of unknown function (DUF3806)
VSDQKIDAPTEAEMRWVESNLDVAQSLARAYTDDEETSLPRPPLLDEIFAAWLAEWHEEPEAERDDPNIYINAIGLAFGQALVDEVGLLWAVVSDKHGTEIAVHGEPGDLLVFPPNLVAKRFEKGETGFLAPIYEEIKARAHQLRNA